MATKKSSKKTSKKIVTVENESVALKVSNNNQSLLDQLKEELKSSQSYSNLILGLIIILIIGILLLSYFKRTQSELGGATQTPSQTQQSGDVTPETLPGKYIIKEGDTLFSIAEKYYKDGYQYPKIVESNNLMSENAIEVGQTINIPKLEATPTPSPTPAQ